MTEKKKTIKTAKKATTVKPRAKKEIKKKEIAEKVIKVVKEKKEEVLLKISETEEGKSPRKSYLYAVGRRKEASAQVRLIKNGSGKVIVNGREVQNYFGSPLLQEIVASALKVVGQDNKLDISAKVSGGGLRGQAEAIRLGSSRALLLLNPVFRKSLRRHGFLTRDPRMKERKKPGLKRARRAPQWQKR